MQLHAKTLPIFPPTSQDIGPSPKFVEGTFPSAAYRFGGVDLSLVFFLCEFPQS